MSDFNNPLWDYFIAIISIVSIVGCAVLLWSQSKRRTAPRAQVEPSTTGHVFDGDLQEYNNPLPRWWMWLFYITVFFSIIYLILYPGLGTQYKGTLNWSSAAQHTAEVKQADERYGPIFAKYLGQDLRTVAADDRARQMGERIFLNNCAQCHGSDARGSRGFPNLTDREWQWGGTPAAIKATIAEGRQAAMPPMADALGGGDAVTAVAHYVLSLSDSAHDSARAAIGREKFAACAACHGAEGKGNPALGAPDLTNKIWNYGGSLATISDTIQRGRSGVMPAWRGILSDAEIHLVTAYLMALNPSTLAQAEAPGKR